MAANDGGPRRRRGRPTKAEEVASTLAAAGCDPALIDPLRILAGILADETCPPMARVAAAKVLLAARSQDPGDATIVAGTLADRAIKLITAARRGH